MNFPGAKICRFIGGRSLASCGGHSLTSGAIEVLRHASRLRGCEETLESVDEA